jgi:Tol biopolymer transport system component
VAFWSNASNLVPDDTNRTGDVFVRDREVGTTTRVSVASDLIEADSNSSDPSISPDGRYVAFWSSATNLVAGDGNGVRDIFVHDREAAATTRVSVASDGTEGNADSFSPNIGADGGTVAFDSEASTLVPGDTNRGSDIFIHTRDTVA